MDPPAVDRPEPPGPPAPTVRRHDHCALELDVRARREENARTLRWAAELAVSADARSVRLGLAALDALASDEQLLASESTLVLAVAEAVAGDAGQSYDPVLRLVPVVDDADPDDGG